MGGLATSSRCLPRVAHKKYNKSYAILSKTKFSYQTPPTLLFSNAHHFATDEGRMLRLNSISSYFWAVSESHLFCSIWFNRRLVLTLTSEKCEKSKKMLSKPLRLQKIVCLIVKNSFVRKTDLANQLSMKKSSKNVCVNKFNWKSAFPPAPNTRLFFCYWPFRRQLTHLTHLF